MKEKQLTKTQCVENIVKVLLSSKKIIRQNEWKTAIQTACKIYSIPHKHNQKELESLVRRKLLEVLPIE